MAKVIQIIETMCAKGEGTKEKPYYTAIQYWSFDGELLWETPDPQPLATVE